MDEIIEVIEQGTMPLKSYTRLHSDARLSEAEKQWLIRWAQQVKAEIAAVP